MQAEGGTERDRWQFYGKLFHLGVRWSAVTVAYCTR
jgi:hypothetical protein